MRKLYQLYLRWRLKILCLETNKILRRIRELENNGKDARYKI